MKWQCKTFLSGYGGASTSKHEPFQGGNVTVLVYPWTCGSPEVVHAVPSKCSEQRVRSNFQNSTNTKPQLDTKLPQWKSLRTESTAFRSPSLLTPLRYDRKVGQCREAKRRGYGRLADELAGGDFKCRVHCPMPKCLFLKFFRDS